MTRQTLARRLASGALAVLTTLSSAPGAQQSAAATEGPVESSTGGVVLLPTSHPRLPRELSQFWFVPENPKTPATEVVAAMKLHAKGDDIKALPVLSRPSSHQGTLGLYAMFDMGMALLNGGKSEEARRTFQTISSRKPIGYLNEAASFGEAQAAEALKDNAAAIAIYEKLLEGKPAHLDEVLIRLGTAARADGQLDKAAAAFSRVYYGFPLSEYGPTAGSELARLQVGADRDKLEMSRAEKLFSAKQYTAAKSAFTALRADTHGDDRELVDLRIAESNYFLKRTRDARDGLRPFIKDASRQAEALYFYAVTARDLGDVSEYETTVRRVVDEFPKQSWAEEALNNLATYFIIKDEDDKADQTFRELYAKYPRGPYAERAAWKVGWHAYLLAQYAETATFFERAASDFPRSDYRPAWLYWSGRAHEQLKEKDLSTDWYALVVADYLNSYYGRLATKRLAGKAPASSATPADSATAGAAAAVVPAAGSAAPPSVLLIRALLSAGLYDHAANELRYAQRTSGDSPAIQATLAWLAHEQGLQETGPPRFTALVNARTTMRRAYPQFLAAGGEQMPREILSVIFPLQYWDAIRRYSAVQGLDPYLVAALVCQESTFAPDVRSSANAWGLMQLLPGTARQLARKLKMPYATRLLTDPDANIRMGTMYFAEKVREFGAVHLALASYNAGESAVHQWVAERPGFGVEEFIDDIPYPETQNYVKRILGTTEDYRRLYK